MVIGCKVRQNPASTLLPLGFAACYLRDARTLLPLGFAACYLRDARTLHPFNSALLHGSMGSGDAIAPFRWFKRQALSVRSAGSEGLRCHFSVVPLCPNVCSRIRKRLLAFVRIERALRTWGQGSCVQKVANGKAERKQGGSNVEAGLKQGFGKPYTHLTIWNTCQYTGKKQGQQGF